MSTVKYYLGVIYQKPQQKTAFNNTVNYCKNNSQILQILKPGGNFYKTLPKNC